MAALEAAIHVSAAQSSSVMSVVRPMDGRVKPGHDEQKLFFRSCEALAQKISAPHPAERRQAFDLSA